MKNKNTSVKFAVNVFYDLDKGESLKESYHRMFNILDKAGYENEFSFTVIEEPSKVED